MLYDYSVVTSPTAQRGGKLHGVYAHGEYVATMTYCGLVARARVRAPRPGSLIGTGALCARCF